MIGPNMKAISRSSRIWPVLAAVLLWVHPAPAAETWSVELARTIMEKYPNLWNYPGGEWSYPHGHVFEGIDMVRRNTGDPDRRYYNYLLSYANHHAGSGVGGGSMDDMMAGVSFCWAYAQTKSDRYKNAATNIRNSFNDYPRTSTGAFWHGRGLEGEFWIDGVFMGEMFLTRYGTHVGDSAYCRNEAAKQLKLAYQHLSKGNNLLLHAWDEDKDASWANRQTGLSPEVWGEGLGWYSNILVEALEAIPAGHPDRRALETQLDSLASGLKRFQDVSGCWWDIVDKPGVGENWTCVSATAFFVYAIKKGVDLGLLDSAVYGPVARKGYNCLLTKLRKDTQNRVVVGATCEGLGVQDNWNDYMNCSYVENAKEATAAVLWATAIMEKPANPSPVAQPVAAPRSQVRKDSRERYYDLCGRLCSAQAGILLTMGKRAVCVDHSNGGTPRIVIVR